MEYKYTTSSFQVHAIQIGSIKVSMISAAYKFPKCISFWDSHCDVTLFHTRSYF